MARDENPPVARGKTFFDGATIAASDVTETQYLEGKEWTFEDIDYSTQGAKGLRSGRLVKCRLVRNTGAAALLPKRVVRYEADGIDFGARVNGYTAVDAQDWAGVVDEFLPAAGVAVNDLFWIVVEGPSLCKTDIAAVEGNVIASGDRVVALTGATSGATTSGRIQKQAAILTGGLLAAATSGVTDFSDVFNHARNAIGRALSAKTTGNTDADILIHVTRL